jgi:hypothetical protein
MLPYFYVILTMNDISHCSHSTNKKIDSDKDSLWPKITEWKRGAGIEPDWFYVLKTSYFFLHSELPT